MHIVRHLPAAQEKLLDWITSGALLFAFHAEAHVPALRALLRKYRDRPISLADACIVRMAEINRRHIVFTLDSDFTIYRKDGHVPIDVLSPLVS